MQVHRGVLEQINNHILPYALRVNGFGIPYPAEFWGDGEVRYEDGTAIFGVKDGWLNVEFLTEDTMIDHSYLIDDEITLVLKGSQIEVPVFSCRPSEKTRTMYAGKRLQQQGYECDIYGWIGGDVSTQMRCAIITIANLPNLHLPEEGLILNAGDWVITLRPHSMYPNEDSDYLYDAVLARHNDEPFALSDSDMNSGGIIAALRGFLSFQCGYWIDFSTIVCHPPRQEGNEKISIPFPSLDAMEGETSESKLVEIPKQSLVERAWLGKLTSDFPDSPSGAWTATDVSAWHRLIPEFWRLYGDSDLEHSVKYYVQSSRLLDIDMEYAFVAMRSTLEALIRWWCGSSSNNRLGSKAFMDGLQSAIEEADLGLESGRKVDIEGLKQAFQKILDQYRNNIAHAHRLGKPLDEQTIVDGHGFQWHIARMLILAKLGHRKADWRGRLVMPPFVKR
ncbi:MAG: hypothetical protein OXD31_18755 [Chloroflexi bacterium]|nr:hypothetical protein [Chloroflexota bacterium]